MAHQNRLRDIQHFAVTEEHLALLQRPRILNGINNVTSVDLKRSYGNSAVYRNLAEILNIKPEVIHDWKAPELSDQQIEYIERIHREMEVVTQILVTNLRIHVGDYVRNSPHAALGWAPVEEGSK